MARFRKCVAAWCCLLLICSSASGQQPPTLRYQFKKGEQFAFTIQNALTAKASDGNVEDFMGMVMQYEVSWNVEDVDKNGQARITGKVTRLRMDITTGVNPQKTETVFDSEDKGPAKDENLAAMMTVLLNNGVSWKMDATGKITDTDVPPELVKFIKDQKGMVTESVADEVLYIMHPLGLTLPTEGAIKGKSWAGKLRKVTVQEDIKVAQQWQFAFEGTEQRDGREMARIAVKPNLTLDLGEKAKTLNIKVSGEKSSGVAYFDNATGKIAGGEMFFEFALEIAGQGGGTGEFRGSITMTPKKAK